MEPLVAIDVDAKKEQWKVCRPVVADSRQFDLDPHQSEKSDPDQNEKSDPEPDQTKNGIPALLPRLIKPLPILKFLTFQN